MFTGIVEEIGTVVALDRPEGEGAADRARLTVSCREVLSDASLGASMAVNGCCVTVGDLSPPSAAGGDAGSFTADLMRATLRATTLGDLTVDARVNLERPLAADGRVGGHVVQGHVDDVGEVVGRDERSGTVVLTVRIPAELLRRYLVAKGSVTVDGVSLTVVDTDDERATFRVGLVPHTCDVTTLGGLDVGDRVNIEVDVLAKYVERVLQSGSDTPYA